MSCSAGRAQAGVLSRRVQQSHLAHDSRHLITIRWVLDWGRPLVEGGRGKSGLQENHNGPRSAELGHDEGPTNAPGY